MDYITAKQAADKWGISMRWVQALLKDGRIEGAIRPGRDWLIPCDAQKPVDPRKVRQERGEPYHIHKNSDHEDGGNKVLRKKDGECE